MTSRLAPSRGVRCATGLDVGIVVVLAMLLWPFPLARANLSPSAHAAAIAVWVVFALCAYQVAVLTRSGRSLGMYLSGLRLSHSSPGGSGRILRWAIGWTLVCVPGLLLPALVNGERALPVRFSGLRLEQE